MASVLYEKQMGENHVLIIDVDKPHPLTQFKIDNSVFKSVLVHDNKRAIAFKGSGHFIGKTVEFE